jgi:uncharacterized membrane protein YeaQ/YmgE (transglycosylase-associated protein family)
VGVFGWIFFGLLAGFVARALTPGRHSIGCFGTLAVGVVGALLGGFLGEAVLDEKIDFGWDLKPFLFAVAGSTVLLLGLNALNKR